ncbi:MAG: cytochrome P450, partial [Hyphomonadaceae bacterium]
MAHTLARPLAFDIEGAAFKRDPHPTFARMREAGPVIPMRLPFVGKAWVTTTYAATEEMVKANDRFVQEARHAGKPGTVAGMQWWMPKRVRLLADNMLLKDEPDHRRLRTLVNQAFQRRGIQSMRGDIEARADRLLDAMAARNETDLVAGYARRLPLIVISDLLGLPETDRGLFEEMSKAAFSVTKALDAIKAFGAIGRLVAYVEAQIDAARHAPRPGLIAELVRAEAQGERLSPNDLVSMVVI